MIIKKATEKDFKKIPKIDTRKILQRIDSLTIEPRPINCEKLSDRERYRIRQGRYRIIYSIQDNELTVWVVKIGHRKDIYR